MHGGLVLWKSAELLTVQTDVATEKKKEKKSATNVCFLPRRPLYKVSFLA